MNSTELLAAWLRAAPRGRPAEQCGTASLLTAYCGTPVIQVTLDRRSRQLSSLHTELLQPLGGTAVHVRRTLLLAGSVPAAAVTAVILPDRLPAPARSLLGVTAAGDPAPAAGEFPVSRAVAGLGARREPLEVRLTPGRLDNAGHEQVICSVARLWLAAPAALVVERIYASFLAAYPYPAGDHHRSAPGTVSARRGPSAPQRYSGCTLPRPACLPHPGGRCRVNRDTR